MAWSLPVMNPGGRTQSSNVGKLAARATLMSLNFSFVSSFWVFQIDHFFVTSKWGLTIFFFFPGLRWSGVFMFSISWPMVRDDRLFLGQGRARREDEGSDPAPRGAPARGTGGRGTGRGRRNVETGRGCLVKDWSCFIKEIPGTELREMIIFHLILYYILFTRYTKYIYIYILYLYVLCVNSFTCLI